MESDTESKSASDYDGLQKESDDDERTDFDTVLESINLDSLPGYASEVRQALDPNAPGVKKIGSTIFGSWHLIWPVIFGDGVKWLFKVPAYGNRGDFTVANSASLRAEALTMRLLRRETTIPVQEIFAFNDKPDNEFNCAFLLVRFVEGKSLEDVWFDMTAPKEILQRRRTRALRDIAACMVQLERYSFDKGGTLLFDDQDRLSGIGPTVTPDTFGVGAPHFEDVIIDSGTMQLVAGPFDDPREYYEIELDWRGDEDTILKTGGTRLLRLFFKSMQQPRDGRKPFVLAHQDLSIDNFIVSEEGEVLAIIDWEYVMCVPRTLGYERLPNWLTIDWHPFYQWTEEIGSDARYYYSYWKQSPETLKYFRSVFASAVWSCQHHGHTTRPIIPTFTTDSLIYDSLYMAAASPPAMMGILGKVFDEIKTILKREGIKVEGEHDDEGAFTCDSVLAALGEDRLSEHRRRLLVRGFRLLLKHSYEL